MEENGTSDDILILDNAIGLETDVLLLTNALAPEPVIKKIEVGPRISRFELQENLAERDRASVPGNAAGRNIAGPAHPPEPAPMINEGEAAQQRFGDTEAKGLAQLLAEARALASDYGVMNLRSRNALYAALGRTYDLTFYADSQPEAYSRLIEEAGLTSQDRSPYTPIIKLVFGPDYDKTRVAEFAAAIVYGRRKNVLAGSFPGFLGAFGGGLKAVVGLERLMRKGDDHSGADSARKEARPAITRKLRTISLQTWDDLPSEGDEFVLLVARRLPDGSIAMVGEVPRDITLLEKAARKLLANLGHTDENQTASQGSYTEVV